MRLQFVISDYLHSSVCTPAFISVLRVEEKYLFIREKIDEIFSHHQYYFPFGISGREL